MQEPEINPDVSIIFVNYHTSALINDCLHSISTCVHDILYEVIIVDNATEKLSDTIEVPKGMDVHFIQLKENIGFGKANNVGAAVARGRNLFILNSDTLLLNNAVKILSDYIDAHPECGICGGNLYDGECHPTFSMRHFLPGISWYLNDILHLIPERIIYGRSPMFNDTGSALEVSFITGADTMISKKLFDSIKGFSDDFFMYYEDADLCSRVRSLGYLITSVPDARIVHLEGGSFGHKTESGVSQQRIEYGEHGRVTYFLRNHSLPYRFAVHLTYITYHGIYYLLSLKPFFRISLVKTIKALFQKRNPEKV